MATKKKTTKKKAAPKKTKTAKKATKTKATKVTKAKKAPKKAKATAKKASTPAFEKVSKSRTKSQILAALADRTGLSKKEIGGVFEGLEDLIGHDLKKGPGAFTVPGLLKVVVVRKPATKSRKGTNPFTGEEMVFKAKPARNVVKIRPLKGLKDKV